MVASRVGSGVGRGVARIDVRRRIADGEIAVGRVDITLVVHVASPASIVGGWTGGLMTRRIVLMCPAAHMVG